MTNRKLLAEYKMTDADIEEEVRKAMGDGTPEEMRAVYEESIKDFKAGTVLKGKAVKILDDSVISTMERVCRAFEDASRFAQKNGTEHVQLSRHTVADAYAVLNRCKAYYEREEGDDA